jgi:hypothetical protein
MRTGTLIRRRLLVFVILAAGCGTTEQPRKPSAGTASPADAVLRIDVATLPPVGDPLPPLDGGRLQLAGPRGWVLPPRDKQWLVRFQTQPDVAYPSILVTGKDAIGIESLTAKNVRDFADRTQSALDDELRPQKQRLLKPVAPLRIGDRYWIEYARGAQAGGTRLERLFLVTVVAGREYTIELRTYVGSLAKRRPEALAVAAKMKVLTANPPAEAGAPAPAPTEAGASAAP